MLTQSLEEWRAEMDRRFPSRDDVAFICPACGHIATIKDHVDAGGEDGAAPQQCIGRINGMGTKNQKDKGNGCNWAAFGLLGTLGKGRKIEMPDGNMVEVFDFAPAKEAASDG